MTTTLHLAHQVIVINNNNHKAGDQQHIDIAYKIYIVLKKVNKSLTSMYH